MENLQCRMDFPLIFDLKGSILDRRTTHDHYINIESIPRTKVYKDVDFFNHLQNITVENVERVNMLRSIKLDTELLEKYSIMDYSLLLLIEETKSLKGSMIEPFNFVKYQKYVVLIGIIDYLQTYDIKKQIENKIKKMRKHETIQISAISPKPYKKRFIEMIEKVFIESCLN